MATISRKTSLARAHTLATINFSDDMDDEAYINWAIGVLDEHRMQTFHFKAIMARATRTQLEIK